MLDQYTTLHEYQNYLNARLGEAEQDSPPPLLAITAANMRWLLEPVETEGVAHAQDITPVPHTSPCFIGLSNVRGTLYAVSDLSRLAGAQATVSERQAKLVLVSHRYESNAALLVDGDVQLCRRNLFSLAAEPTRDDSEGFPAWSEALYQDSSNEAWRMINLPTLLKSREFMEIGA